MPDVDLRLKEALHLRTRFAQQLRFLAQTDHPVLEHTKQQLLAVGEEAVFVLTQLTGHVVELRVVAKPGAGLLAQRGHRRGKAVELVRQYPVLERLDAVLQLFEPVQVAGDELLKKVVEKLADTAVGPALFPGDAAQHPL